MFQLRKADRRPSTNPGSSCVICPRHYPSFLEGPAVEAAVHFLSLFGLLENAKSGNGAVNFLLAVDLVILQEINGLGV